MTNESIANFNVVLKFYVEMLLKLRCAKSLAKAELLLAEFTRSIQA